MNQKAAWFRTPEGLAAIILGAITFVLAIPIVPFAFGRSPAFLRDLGFLSGPRGTPAAWVAALVLASLYIRFSMNLPAVRERWGEISPLKGLAVLASVAAGIVEEAFFRRWIMDGVMRTGGDAWIQVVVSALAFGVAHASWGLIKGSLRMAVRAAAATTTLGVGLAVVYLLGERSLAPCITAHFLVTAVIEPGLMIAAVRGEMGR